MEKASVIRQHRSKQGFTQEQLGEILDVTKVTIRNWEKKRTTPNVHEILKLSAVLEVSLDDLMNEYSNINKDKE